ncbi:MAG: CYTH domain-containing protein, partial [Candidatus Paceibacterota bacterium]
MISQATKKTKEEIEFKWSVSSAGQFEVFSKTAKSLGAATGSPRAVVNRDLYLDTAARALERNRMTCRLRDSGGVFEFTLKNASKIKGGLARRTETNVPLPGVKNMAIALELVRSLFHHPAAAGGEL